MIPLAMAFGSLAAADWVAVAAGNRPAERWLKPAALVALIGLALSLRATSTGAGVAILIALVFGLAGDAFLLGDGDARFMAGLGSFLVGHLAYLVAFVLIGGLTTSWVAGVALIVLGSAGRLIFTGARAAGGTPLASAVAAYMLVIAAMTAVGGGLHRPLVTAGVLLFLASDTLLGWARFVSPLPRSRPAVMATYHVGQLLIVLGALR